MGHKKNVMIRHLENYQVHNPENSAEFLEVPTLQAARFVADVVKKVGWDKTKTYLEQVRNLNAQAEANETRYRRF